MVQMLGGGNVIDISRPSGALSGGMASLVKGFQSIQQAKEQQAQDALMQILGNLGPQATPQDILSVLNQPKQQPGGFMGVLDAINPFSPARGMTGLERNLRANPLEDIFRQEDPRYKLQMEGMKASQSRDEINQTNRVEDRNIAASDRLRTQNRQDVSDKNAAERLEISKDYAAQSKKLHDINMKITQAKLAGKETYADLSRYEKDLQAMHDFYIVKDSLGEVVFDNNGNPKMESGHEGELKDISRLWKEVVARKRQMISGSMAGQRGSTSSAAAGTGPPPTSSQPLEIGPGTLPETWGSWFPQLSPEEQQTAMEALRRMNPAELEAKLRAQGVIQ